MFGHTARLMNAQSLHTPISLYALRAALTGADMQKEREAAVAKCTAFTHTYGKTTLSQPVTCMHT